MITCAWLFAQARKSGNDEWEIAVDGKVMRGAWRVIRNSPVGSFADLHLIVIKVLISARRA